MQCLKRVHSIGMFSQAIDFNSALFQARNFKFAKRFREVFNVSTFRRQTITNRLEFSEKIIEKVEKVKKVLKSSRTVGNHSYIRMVKCVLVQQITSDHFSRYLALTSQSKNCIFFAKFYVYEPRLTLLRYVRTGARNFSLHSVRVSIIMQQMYVSVSGR